MKTIKLIMLTFALLSAVNANASVILTLDNDVVNVDVNEVFSLNVLAASETPVDSISGFALQAFFDVTDFELTNTEINGLFLPSGFLIGAEFGGSVNPVLVPPAFPNPFPSIMADNLVLVTLTFAAKTVGSFSIDIGGLESGLLPGFTNASFFPSAFNPVSLEVNVSAASESVPAPSMFAAMLVIFGFLARRVAR